MIKFTLMQTAILSLLDVFQYYFFVNRVVNKQLMIQLRALPYVVVTAGMIATVSVISDGPLVYFINSMILMLFSYVLYKVKGIKLLYLHLISAMCVLTLQLIVLILFELLRVGTIELFTMGLVAQSVSVVGAYFVARKLPLELLLNYVDANNKLFKVIIANVFLLLTACVVTWYLKVDSVLKNLNLFTLFTAFILLINTILLKTSLKNQLVEEQKEIYEQYMPIVNSLIDEVRAKQHDFDNHIQALRMMICQEQDFNKAKMEMENYIDDLYGEFQERDLIRLENKMVAGFLYSKIKKAKEEGVQLDIRVEECGMHTAFKDFEILEILSILIDNAFETGVAENHVKVELKKEKHKSVIEVLNKHAYVFTEHFQKMFSHGYSSKGERNRGIGLHKLQQIINRAEGQLEVANCDLGGNYVSFKVTLP